MKRWMAAICAAALFSFVNTRVVHHHADRVSTETCGLCVLGQTTVPQVADAAPAVQFSSISSELAPLVEFALAGAAPFAASARAPPAA